MCYSESEDLEIYLFPVLSKYKQYTIYLNPNSHQSEENFNNKNNQYNNIFSINSLSL